MQKLYLEGTPLGEGGEQPSGKGVALNRFPAIIGRHSECDYSLNYPFVSRRHCEFFERDGKLWVQDLSSQNGTFLNGEALRFPRPVRDGDRLDVAYVSFHVRLGLCEATDDSITVVRDTPSRREALLAGQGAR
jgi:pSer/pThr/pTyr-binding forkhead associated (FHA) protein